MRIAKVAVGQHPRNRSWSVNGRFLGRNPTGVDRYAFEIIKAMDSLVGEGHPLAQGLKINILCPAGANDVPPFTSIPLRYLPNAPGHVWEQIVLPAFLRGGLLSLCNTGPLAVRQQIVCIHDANTRLAPESYSLSFRSAYRLLEPALGRTAKQITTVSFFSKRMLQEFKITRAVEVPVIFDGHEHVFRWNASKSAVAKRKLPSVFVLVVGSKAPHKNLNIIYKIASDLASEGIAIVVTGGADANVFAQGQSGHIGSNVTHLGRVNDDDLAFLYSRALCLVFPSKTEGFGLPAIEAMALGCPVIASNVASLPEVCGDAALYVAPDDAANWLAAIAKIQREPMLREELSRAGRQRVKAFSWKRGAEQYLELMHAM
jgi:glycosyltransferase involved in cell wall biosynthesis